MFWNGGMWLSFRLGDMVENALSTVGLTSERVERWLGMPCGCKERKDKLNALGAWAARVVSGKTEEAEKYLDELVKDNKSDPSSETKQ